MNQVDCTCEWGEDEDGVEVIVAFDKECKIHHGGTRRPKDRHGEDIMWEEQEA